MASAVDSSNEITLETGTEIAWFGAVLDAVRAKAPRRVLADVAEMRRRLDAVEASALATRRRSGATERRLEEDLAAADPKVTKRDRHRAARRGATIATNPALGDLLASGEIGTAHVDAIAAATVHEPALAAEPDLLAAVRGTSPDRAGRAAKKWVDDRRDDDDLYDQHANARRHRKVTRFASRTEPGLWVLQAEGDELAIAQIYEQLMADSRRLYETDGGRDRRPDDHPRTRDQRLFDALHARVTDAGDASSPANANRTPRSGAVAKVFITHTLTGLLSGADHAQLLGGGPVPRSVFADHLATASITGIIFGRRGDVLWKGRATRLATAAQTDAATARDGGCVLCTAPPSRCHTHHIIPSNAPARGPTDIDNLALVCSDCHHRLHSQHLTLQRDRVTGEWHTRAARPDEIAPARRPA